MNVKLKKFNNANYNRRYLDVVPLRLPFRVAISLLDFAFRVAILASPRHLNVQILLSLPELESRVKLSFPVFF